MELGSEYDLDVNALYPKEHSVDAYLTAFHRCFYSSGRAAIRAWARCFLGDGEILLPEYICDTVIRCFPLSRIRFYHVHTDMTADAEDVIRCISSGTSAIFWVNYYGTLQPENARKSVRQAADAHGIRILEDMTQSFLTATGTIGDDFVASLRKWFPIPMGGVLYSRQAFPQAIYEYPPSTQNEKIVPSILKHISLLGGGRNYNSEYRKMFVGLEERLDKTENITRMSELTTFMLSCFDLRKISEKRKANFSYLERELRERCGISPALVFSEGDCPFAYPLRAKAGRDAFRAYLINHHVYCAVHWPRDGICEAQRPMMVKNADTLISLPIDQRYGRKEMSELARIVSQYRGC